MNNSMAIEPSRAPWRMLTLGSTVWAPFGEHGWKMLILLAVLIVSAISALAAEKKALSKRNLLQLLSGGVYKSRIAQLVRRRGISFVRTTEDLESLRHSGTNRELLNAVWSARHPLVALPKPPAHPAAQAPAPVRPTAGPAHRSANPHQIESKVRTAESPSSRRGPDTLCSRGHMYSQHDVIGDPETCILGRLSGYLPGSSSVSTSGSIGGVGSVGVGMSAP